MVPTTAGRHTPGQDGTPFPLGWDNVSSFGRIGAGERRQPAATRLRATEQHYEACKTILALGRSTRDDVVQDLINGIEHVSILNVGRSVIHGV